MESFSQLVSAVGELKLLLFKVLIEMGVYFVVNVVGFDCRCVCVCV